MNKYNEKKDEWFEPLKEKMQVHVSKEASEKSLLAFQKGLKGAESKREKRGKARYYRAKVTGMIAGTVAVGIAALLIINTELIGNNQPGKNGNNDVQHGIGENRDREPDEAKTNIQKAVSEEDILKKALNRPAFTAEDLNGMPAHQIFNEKLEVNLPPGWTVAETEDADKVHTQMTGSEGEQMNLLLFTGAADKETFDTHINEWMADFKTTEEISVSADELIERISEDHLFPLPYDSGVPFNKENAEMTVFFNEDNGRIMEIYVSELFGYPMIFTSEFLYDDVASWNNSIIFFTYMFPAHLPFDIQGSAGEIHPVYERPIEKEVMLRVGAIGAERVEVELFESDELGLTSYLPKNMDKERIEHDYFVEWRFTERDVPGESLIAFGKLKDGFPLDQAIEIMFGAHGIDLSHYIPSEPDAPLSNFYSYQDYSDGYIDGYFHLFEAEGEWYYKHYHGEFSEYNGGVYSQRLDMFMESIEWN